MKPSFFRVTFALATFLCGSQLASWQLTARQHTSTATASPNVETSASPRLIPPAQLPTPISFTSEEEPLQPVQEEVLNMKGVGRVRVTAYERSKGFALLKFTDASTGKELFNEYCGRGDGFRVLLRFKVVRLEGLPGPLVLAVAMSPGGSDSSWEASVIGAAQGDIQRLTYERLTTSNQGGFFVGDLGGGLGPGAAAWCFIWGEDEGHYQEHQYEVTLYKWSAAQARFRWHKTLRTKGEFDSGERAMRSLGLRFTDLRKTFPEFAEMEEW